MSTKIFNCEFCGEIYNGELKDSFICQTCGNRNKISEIIENNIKIQEDIEHLLEQSIEKVKLQLQSSGDVAARDFLYTKHYKPKIDIHYENLLEKYEDFFRRPLFTFEILKRINSIFNVEKVFERENTEGFNPDYIKELNHFVFGTLNDETIQLLASGPNSKEHIYLIQNNLDFISKIYLIRGNLLNINQDSINIAKRLFPITINICQELLTKYSNIKNTDLDRIKFQSWKDRLEINLKITNLIDLCFDRKYKDCQTEIEKILSEIDENLDKFRNLHKEDQDKYPLFMIMIIAEGFNVDKKIVQFIDILVNFSIEHNIQQEFSHLINHITEFFDITNTPFNKTSISSDEWNDNWINEVEDPFKRLIEIIDLISFNIKVSKGVTEIKTIEPDIELPGPWTSNAIIKGKDLNKNYYKLGDFYHVKSSSLIYFPMAVMNTYAILKKGFIRKGGDEFESYLLINPLFRLDNTINRFGYPRAFAYIDFEEKLKDKDPLKQNLSYFENLIESESNIIKINENNLPLIATKKEIEEFIQKTYDLFYFFQETGREPINDFKKNYKNVGIAKNLEKLSGELIDYIYVPSLLINIAKGSYKKDNFIQKEDYQLKFLFPFNNNPKEPWNTFLRMKFNPNSIIQLIDSIKKFQ